MLRVPSLEKIEVLYHYSRGEDEGWNECYHRYMDHLQQVVAELSNDRDPLNTSVLNKAVDLHYSLFAVRGDFNSRAMGAVKLIVDEFSLPLSLKTVRPLKLMEDDGDNEVIYEVDGIVLRPVNVLSSSNISALRDYDKMSTNCGVPGISFCISDVRRSIAAHEISGMHWIEKIVCSQDFKTSSSIDLRQPLSTIVDYAGYRFSAHADISLTSKDSLVHGFSDTEGLFVNTMNEVNKFVPYLAQQLGISCVPKLLPSRDKSFRGDIQGESVGNFPNFGESDDFL